MSIPRVDEDVVYSFDQERLYKLILSDNLNSTEAVTRDISKLLFRIGANFNNNMIPKFLQKMKWLGKKNDAQQQQKEPIKAAPTFKPMQLIEKLKRRKAESKTKEMIGENRLEESDSQSKLDSEESYETSKRVVDNQEYRSSDKIESETGAPEELEKNKSFERKKSSKQMPKRKKMKEKLSGKKNGGKEGSPDAKAETGERLKKLKNVRKKKNVQENTVPGISGSQEDVSSSTTSPSSLTDSLGIGPRSSARKSVRLVIKTNKEDEVRGALFRSKKQFKGKSRAERKVTKEEDLSYTRLPPKEELCSNDEKEKATPKAKKKRRKRRNTGEMRAAHRMRREKRFEEADMEKRRDSESKLLSQMGSKLGDDSVQGIVEEIKWTEPEALKQSGEEMNQQEDGRSKKKDQENRDVEDSKDNERRKKAKKEKKKQQGHFARQDKVRSKSFEEQKKHTKHHRGKLPKIQGKGKPKFKNVNQEAKWLNQEERELAKRRKEFYAFADELLGDSSEKAPTVSGDNYFADILHDRLQLKRRLLRANNKESEFFIALDEMTKDLEPIDVKALQKSLKYRHRRRCDVCSEAVRKPVPRECNQTEEDLLTCQVCAVGLSKGYDHILKDLDHERATNVALQNWSCADAAEARMGPWVAALTAAQSCIDEQFLMESLKNMEREELIEGRHFLRQYR